MKKLKNWFVRFESVKGGKKGLLNYLQYLTDNKHFNHNSQTENHRIIKIFNNVDNCFLSNIKSVEDRLNKNLLKNKGGRTPSKYSQSIVLSLPYEIDLSTQREDFEKLGKSVASQFFKNICKIENIEITEKLKQDFQNKLFINGHLKNSGSKTQINIVMSEILGDKKIDLSKKKYSYLMKNIFNQEVKKHLGIDFNNYELEELKTRKKKVPQQKYKLSQEVKKYQSLISDLQQQKEELKRNEKLTELEKEMYEEKLESVKGYEDRLIRDIERFEKETNENRKEMLVKRLEKNYTSISDRINR